MCIHYSSFKSQLALQAIKKIQEYKIKKSYTVPITIIMMSENNSNNNNIVENNEKKNDNSNTSLNKFNWVNLISYLLNTFVTFAIGTFGLFGRPNNGVISDKYQTLVTPWGSAFSIWGIIFIWQAIWVVWQIVLPNERNSIGVTKAWYYYAIMTILQIGWTITFSYELMWASLIFMYGILASLVLASMSLQTYQKSIKGYLLWQAPFSVQTGWIMAASAVMTNVLPVYYNASVSVEIGVASASVVVLVITAISWLSSYPVDFAIPLVIIWALGGVYAELKEPMDVIVERFTTKQIDGIKYGVLAALVLVGVSTIVKILYVLFKQRPNDNNNNERSNNNNSRGHHDINNKEVQEEGDFAGDMVSEEEVV